ncbi:MAG TPA: hypothetical protein VM925_15765 [Labilithrix sp.]|nr:hypothetical protein [Labilithrix sp.]
MRFMTSGGALCAVAIAACSGEHPPSSVPTGSPPVQLMASEEAALKDDGQLHVYRNYFALEHVGPEAHHFTAWWVDVEPRHCEVTVQGSDVSFDGCGAGGMSIAPRNSAAIPSSVSAEAKLVEAAVHAKTPNASIRLAYHGVYRELVLSEMFLVTNARMMGKPVGWHARIRLRADHSLTRIEGVGAGTSGSRYGMIDTPADAARVDFVLPPSEDGQRLATSTLFASASGGDVSPMDRTLVDRVLAVARDIASGKRGSTIGALYASPFDGSVPATYEQRLALGIRIYARHQNFAEQKYAGLVLTLHPRRAALEGKTVATSDVEIDGIHVKASATMFRFAPSTLPIPSRLELEGRDMETTISLHVEDDRGNVFTRVYTARGRVVGEGPALATPAGLQLPGGSSASKEHDALLWTWQGNGQASSFDFSLSPDLVAEPVR